jgi:glycosyltransferase involved in cell wall biosynthesis
MLACRGVIGLMQIVYFCPIASEPAGGIQVIYRHAELLGELGYHACIFHPESPRFLSSWFSHDVPMFKPARAYTLAKRLFSRTPKCCAADLLSPTDDFAVIPEIWAGALGRQCLDHGVRYAIFVQGGYIMMNGRWPLSSENLQDVYENANVILSISTDTTNMILLAYPHLDPSKILQVLPSIGQVFVDFDHPMPPRQKTITYMRHRLPDHSTKICYFLKPYLPADWAFVEIGKLNAGAVSRTLLASSVFMSFCDLEGFGLPPLEAAFCGNAVVGYTGQGAREYFDKPIFKTIESSNIHAFVTAMIVTISEVENGLLERPELSTQLNALRNQYSTEKQKARLRVFGHRVQQIMA